MEVSVGIKVAARGLEWDVTEVVSLGLLQAPGAMGADIVVAEGQGIGNALGFGGPYLGLFACKENW